MKKEIVINASKDRARIAIVEDGQLAELYVEHPDNVRTLGNIYLGKVAKVMGQIHAAFVDIGQKQDAFLHFSDLTENAPQLFVMAGEDVPGLEAPILAKAPQKRVADDESEPDVEETLEVEDAADESKTARTGRSRSRRRRRGGRGRRGGSGRDGRKTEEEEEQEERRLPHVIDLTQKSGSVRPKPAPKPAPEPASGDENKDTDEAPEAEKPKRTRTRSKKKTDDAPAEDDAPKTDGDAPEAEEAPKPKRKTRSRKKKEDVDGGAEEAASDEQAEKPKRTRLRKKKADAPDDASGADANDADEAPEAEKPKRTRSRSKKKADESNDEVASEEKPKRTRSRSKAKEADDASGDEADEKPKGRVRTPKQEKSDHEKREADEASEDEKPKRTRSRSRKKKDETPEASGDDSGAEEKAEKPKRTRSRKKTEDAPAPEADEPAAEAKPVSHAAKHTIDLSTPSRSSRRSAPKEEEQDDEPRSRRSRSDSEDDASGENSGRSRRSRSKSDDDSNEDSGRSRRGRSRKDEDSDSSSEDDNGRSRRRSRSDSSDDDASGDDSRSRRRSRSTSDDDSDSGDSRRSRSKKDDDADSDDARGSRSRRGGRGSSSKDDDSDDDSRSSRGSRGGRSSERRSDDGGRSEDTRDRGRSGARGGRNGNGRSGGQKGAPQWNGKAEDLLKRGSRVLVKITKEPISSKGSRVSTDISLAGRFLVLVPAADYVAVSKKIESSKERRRLRALASSLKPANCGVIVRTVAGGQDAKALDQDLRLLINKWNKIEAKLDNGNAEPPILLHEDLDMVSSIMRDLFTSDFDRILIDDPHLHRKLQNYVKAVAPDMVDKVQMHRSNQPVFRACGIEKQVEEAFSERVNMKGGGYLIIEHTEAMHVVDVNSGRAGRGKRRAEENLLAVNMEAAKEIGRQLRLRDLGGIICVDFIDLRHDRDRRKVTDAIKKEFAKDRAVTKVIGMSDFGVMQITRQRLRPSITAQDDSEGMDAMEAAGATEIVQPERDHPEPAPEAQEEPRQSGRREASGGGRSRRGESRRGESRRESSRPSEDVSPVQLAERVRDWLAHYRDNVDAKFARKPIVVSVHPLMGSYLRRGFPSPLTRLRFRLRNVPFSVVDDPKVDPLSFEVVDEKSGRPLRSKYPLGDD
ncbi:Rne/Rng family ribonuclease [Rubricoccus marinus]|uniref:RNA-binding protein AU-1/Ribonuclease E/G domain-containing protein n=1 Tax=Rubricoccus marinus TaxID=716817 RepID=A0A259U286_9BACT|nr:Rne/Rng family ribonuclease [Rubricoccus marinus]OZC04060.1 hypothetical protein BSZ36_14345 [Rubricoccus marinus]